LTPTVLACRESGYISCCMCVCVHSSCNIVKLTLVGVDYPIHHYSLSPSVWWWDIEHKRRNRHHVATYLTNSKRNTFYFYLILIQIWKNQTRDEQRKMSVATIVVLQLVLSINEPYDVIGLNKRACDAQSYVYKTRRVFIFINMLKYISSKKHSEHYWHFADKTIWISCYDVTTKKLSFSSL